MFNQIKIYMICVLLALLLMVVPAGICGIVLGVDSEVEMMQNKIATLKKQLEQLQEYVVVIQTTDTRIFIDGCEATIDEIKNDTLKGIKFVVLEYTATTKANEFEEVTKILQTYEISFVEVEVPVEKVLRECGYGGEIKP